MENNAKNKVMQFLNETKKFKVNKFKVYKACVKTKLDKTKWKK